VLSPFCARMASARERRGRLTAASGRGLRMLERGEVDGTSSSFSGPNNVFVPCSCLTTSSSLSTFSLTSRVHRRVRMSAALSWCWARIACARGNRTARFGILREALVGERLTAASGRGLRMLARGEVEGVGGVQGGGGTSSSFLGVNNVFVGTKNGCKLGGGGGAAFVAGGGALGGVVDRGGDDVGYIGGGGDGSLGYIAGGGVGSLVEHGGGGGGALGALGGGGGGAFGVVGALVGKRGC